MSTLAPKAPEGCRESVREGSATPSPRLPPTGEPSVLPPGQWGDHGLWGWLFLASSGCVTLSKIPDLSKHVFSATMGGGRGGGVMQLCLAELLQRFDGLGYHVHPLAQGGSFINGPILNCNGHPGMANHHVHPCTAVPSPRGGQGILANLIVPLPSGKPSSLMVRLKRSRPRPDLQPDLALASPAARPPACKNVPPPRHTVLPWLSGPAKRSLPPPRPPLAPTSPDPDSR